MKRCTKVARFSFLLVPTAVESLQCSCPLKKMSRCFCESETNSANGASFSEWVCVFLFVWFWLSKTKGRYAEIRHVSLSLEVLILRSWLQLTNRNCPSMKFQVTYT